MKTVWFDPVTDGLGFPPKKMSCEQQLMSVLLSVDVRGQECQVSCLSTKNRKLRMEFTQAHRNWTIEE